MAITAMILGLIGMVICPPLGIVGLILGIISLVKINSQPDRLSGRGLAITGIVCGALSPLLIAILLPSLGKSRELANRSYCAANIRGLMQSTVVYSSDYTDNYPYRGPSPVAAAVATSPTQGGVMRSMFVLVGDGSVGPKQFICKSDPASTAVSITPTTISARGDPLVYAPDYWSSSGPPDFSYSYSFASPFSDPKSTGNWWHNTMDSSVAIVADMNPGSQNSASKKNSLNHQGDGQNVGYGDTHAEFVRTPAAGEGDDNIYNLGTNSPSAPGTPGNTLSYPSKTGNSQGTFDTWLVPALTNTTHYDRQ